MNVLLVGSGGREHALAWKLASSPGLTKLFILPGNPGTAGLGVNLPGHPENITEVLNLAEENRINLVIIGPEAPLSAGLADALLEAGYLVFGPSRAAAQIETSKAFSKAFMQRWNIPSASSQTFDQFGSALDYLKAAGREQGLQAQNFVIKASGLAAGKGVFLPDTNREVEKILHYLLVEGGLGEAGKEVVIEERLTGREVSVLAFSDGSEVLVMPPVQDHKRLLDHDRGPNTGGMGTYAPSPACSSEMISSITETILRPTVLHLKEEGLPFTGVLYAGLMLTEGGPRVLEFNCRFGDPETQVLMPLLESDLLEIALACAEGRLEAAAGRVRWRPGAATCVVAASEGYPEKPLTGRPIAGLDRETQDSRILIFHAGTALKDGQIVAAGGRVLGVVGQGDTLQDAVRLAYQGLEKISFEGMHYRRDIGRSEPASQDPRSQGAYATAGVSIEAGNRAVELMRKAVRSTFTPQVLSDIGAFGGLYDASLLKQMREPVLVASTDGVGTKVDLAARAGSYESIGHDIVNHCINDILVQGARPLFFLDYYACSRLDPQQAAEIVAGMSAACREAGCALLGGETAEMPGVYAEGRYDVAGTIVGVVERSRILPRPDIEAGDLLVGLASSGPHTNGYSLIRRIFEGIPLERRFPELEVTLAEALLAPHRSYLSLLAPLLFPQDENGPAQIKALAHITGGGFYDNLPRVLPAGSGIRVRRNSWPIPALFQLIRRLGGVEEEEMYRVFNMGIGMAAIIQPGDLESARLAIGEDIWVIGEVISEEGVYFV
jgi:phosphoribosylamine--glycine ligase / phosphoribosylformylglycinamidine cyclo-ligase